MKASEGKPEKDLEGGDEIALEALQSQLNDLKALLEQRFAQLAPVVELEDAVLGAADALAAMSPAYFSHDVRQHVKRVTGAAAAILARREGRVEGNGK